MNYRKIVQKKKLCRPKQQKIGYLMIHDVICLLAILIENWRFSTDSFKVYCILKQVMHNFSSDVLSSDEEIAFSYGLDQHIPSSLNKTDIDAEFEQLYHELLKAGVRNRESFRTGEFCSN